jgi:hypothetical protein
MQVAVSDERRNVRSLGDPNKGSTAFERAWVVVKMARHAIGPTEIWDAAERLRDETGRSGQGVQEAFAAERNLPTTQPLNAEDGHDPTIFYPLAGNPFFGNQQTKVMMTPHDFLGLVLQGGSEHRYENTLEGMRNLMEQGAPISIPNLSVTNSAKYGHDADFSVTGHEGRHRMQTLIDMGYGDMRVPVLVSTDDWFGDPYNQYGGNERYQEALMGSVLEPETDDRYDDGSQSRQFTIDEINPLWRRGEVEQL